MKILHSVVIEVILEELAKARKSYPTWPIDPIHAASIVAEECGELQQAVNDQVYPVVNNKEDDANKRVFKEAVQTAAMAIRFLQNWPYGDSLNTARRDDSKLPKTENNEYNSM